MSETWLAACRDAHTFVDARHHLLHDPAAEKQHGFSLATAYERAQRGLLLQGMCQAAHSIG